MAKTTDTKDPFHESDEMVFDSRLLDKKVNHQFLTREEKEKFLKGLPEETEYEFTSMAEVEKLEDSDPA